MHFMMDFSISTKNAIGVLIEITLKLWIALGSTDILTVLNLTIHEHGMSSIYLCLLKLPSATFSGFQ